MPEVCEEDYGTVTDTEHDDITGIPWQIQLEALSLFEPMWEFPKIGDPNIVPEIAGS